MYQEYLKILGDIPAFLDKYLKIPCLVRLKQVSYFCGMDYASKDIYNFREYLSRYDHSLSVALLVYKLTHDKVQTLASLFHDVATPCFSHAIDYMNKDYATQESTEEYTEVILRGDAAFLECLKEDNLSFGDVANYKKYSLVDNSRPKLCADRLDGVILTGFAWTRDLDISDIKEIIVDLTVFKNESNEDEMGFQTRAVAQKVYTTSIRIDEFCHSREDNFMMELLANICALAIANNVFTYEELYYLTESQILKRMAECPDAELHAKLKMFRGIKLDEIPDLELPYIKARDLNPLLNRKRFKDFI